MFHAGIKNIILQVFKIQEGIQSGPAAFLALIMWSLALTWPMLNKGRTPFDNVPFTSSIDGIACSILSDNGVKYCARVLLMLQDVSML